MKIPKKVKIGGKTYTVSMKKAAKDAHELYILENRAEVWYKEQKILIYDDMNTETKEEVLLHEIIHAINDNMYLGLDEETTQRLATGFYQVLKDNKFNYSDKTVTEKKYQAAVKELARLKEELALEKNNNSSLRKTGRK